MEISTKEAREIADLLDLLYDVYGKLPDHSPAVRAHAKRLKEMLEFGISNGT